MSYDDIGNLLGQTGKPAKAQAAYEAGAAIRRKLADANPAVTQFPALAMSYATRRPASARRGSQAEASAGRRGRPAEAGRRTTLRLQ